MIKLSPHQVCEVLVGIDNGLDDRRLGGTESQGSWFLLLEFGPFQSSSSSLEDGGIGENSAGS
jgi:hypothetical protein